MSCSRLEIELASRSRNPGIASRDLPSASTSRGVADPSVIFASKRSRSRIPPRVLRISARKIVFLWISSTASSRASISANSKDGRSSRLRSSRPPIPVTV